MLTTEQLHLIMPRLKANDIPNYLDLLNQAMEEFEINTSERQAAFLAQISHESGELRWMAEIWGPTDAQKRYEGRKDLGNTEPGDGSRFRGRGPIQITGRANYQKYGDLLDVDLVSHPELASTPGVGFRVAGAFWKTHELNELADKGLELVEIRVKGQLKTVPAFDAITYKINGGFNGLEDRQKYYKRAKAVLAEKAPLPDRVDVHYGGELDAAGNAIPMKVIVTDKGVTTSTKPAAETEGTPPPAPAAEIKASQPSLLSRLGSLSLPAGAMAILGAIGGFLQTIPPWVWAVLGGTALIAGVYLYNEAQKRANARTLRVMDAAASKTENNLRLV
jgi:putative chitinase